MGHVWEEESGSRPEGVFKFVFQSSYGVCSMEYHLVSV